MPNNWPFYVRTFKLSGQETYIIIEKVSEKYGVKEQRKVRKMKTKPGERKKLYVYEGLLKCFQTKTFFKKILKIGQILGSG